MANMNKDNRLGLLACLREKGERLKVKGLIYLAKENHVPFFNDPQLAHLAHLHRKRAWKEGLGSCASDAAKHISYESPCRIPRFTLPTGYSTSALLPLDEAGAEVILRVTKDDKNTLNITLPAPHKSLPFMLIPHQICANIMRKYTDENKKA
ncbi:hypothetical protein BJX70DRAFT_367554 [Aspergillus crustosus]